ncbi:MAG TPA: translation elongation factor 4 [Kiritimatiellia bacterium]|nr:translation elongation factor 4 [Kiritimatiellia bacterium]HMO97905.1 translation elongation factor 4 [Kiritimatiellia bacterium]HMP95575.1 translation elongation factor 4 [Kiritimatiellia bacterium]
MTDLSHIRNFCIIAHIDHGKSTLADRLLEITQAVEKRDLKAQLLDDMDIERERGITIKAHPVTMMVTGKDGIKYIFNLIDTPGHVDFSYEVTRSLAACEGALLVVDATQGVEAQTVANTFLAEKQKLTLIPVINKVDMQNANVDEVIQQIEEILAIEAQDCLRVSAKTGLGVDSVLDAVIKHIPPPVSTGQHTRALVFDSEFDAFRGVVTYVRVVDGGIATGDRIRFIGSGRDFEVKELGIFTPEMVKVERLGAGEVGYLISNIRDPAEVKIGDTVTLARHPAVDPLPGFKDVHPMVFSGLYPIEASDFEKLRFSLDKYKLNDSSFTYMPESSVALGFGFRCGFLGLLHMEVVQERLRREFEVDLITTYPNVVYRVHKTDGTVEELENPSRLPDLSEIRLIEEPMIKAFLICQNESIGDMLQLIMDRRGSIEKTDSLDAKRVMLTCTLPLNEILIDFHDRLKSISRGYASMDYEHAGYRESDLVKMEILVHGEPVEAFSSIIHRAKAESRGRQLCEALKELIPPAMFPIALQAAVNNKIIARETIRAMRKDVTAKCYGGDITRKRKLLERQKEGKKKMKQIGRVSIPQEAFIKVLKGGMD